MSYDKMRESVWYNEGHSVICCSTTHSSSPLIHFQAKPWHRDLLLLRATGAAAANRRVQPARDEGWGEVGRRGGEETRMTPGQPMVWYGISPSGKRGQPPHGSARRLHGAMFPRQKKKQFVEVKLKNCLLQGGALVMDFCSHPCRHLLQKGFRACRLHAKGAMRTSRIMPVYKSYWV